MWPLCFARTEIFADQYYSTRIAGVVAQTRKDRNMHWSKDLEKILIALLETFGTQQLFFFVDSKSSEPEVPSHSLLACHQNNCGRMKHKHGRSVIAEPVDGSGRRGLRLVGGTFHREILALQMVDTKFNHTE